MVYNLSTPKLFLFAIEGSSQNNVAINTLTNVILAS